MYKNPEKTLERYNKEKNELSEKIVVLREKIKPLQARYRQVQKNISNVNYFVNKESIKKT